MSEPRPLLEVEDLAKTYPGRRSLLDHARRRPPARLVALDGVTLALAPHETLGIVGESGSGKSTLAKLIVGLEPPDAGSVRFGELELQRADRRQLLALRREVQLIYQDPSSSLNPRMSVGSALAEAVKVHEPGLDGAARERRVDELLDQVGLARGVKQRRPRALSGGQRQRVAIARALAVRPQVLIADEATSALDVSVQAQILRLFSTLREELGLSMVFISHQLNVVAQVADHVAVMYLGRVVERGPTAAVLGRPRHPYTEALLAAQPSLERRHAVDEVALHGELPSPYAIPTGCRFRTRCPLAQEVCARVDPPAFEVGAEHVSHCHVLPRAEYATIPVPSDSRKAR
jgi:oligopeptide/dipeptide ABC transporter ATP-binding protein